MAGLTRPSHYGLLGTPVEGPGGRTPPRPDWRRLSSGVGVPPGPGSTFPFPPPNVRTTVPESLPPAAEHDSHMLDFDEVFSRWETSSGAAHGRKTHGDVYAQPAYPLIPRVKRTLGIKDFAEKLQLRPCRYPLTMAYQKSETQDKYQGWPNLGPETIRRSGPQPWELADHHAQGPSQAMIPSSKNSALSGQPFFIPEQGVLHRHQPYLTTSARDFRHFTRKELASHPRYQTVCDRPPLMVLEPLRPLPRVPRLGQAHPRVPHRGAVSQTKESYGTLQHPLRLSDRFCPLEAPWVGPQVQPVLGLQTVPHVYRTENSRYGSPKPAFV
ncbi:uncharacterized protein LOC122749292 isoform X1 [Dromiciops gliroides]|uniref:uncharacterized protein LOC122749292 isoform X1 n=1 Tax=Dromiciops gliroides TaxID=33562 RepID=UPI001CC7BE6A|nr:uncharacterized protein LOC122749292 isoform X1 [Dromiciops gliroides]